jgi:hypothetical protein
MSVSYPSVICRYSRDVDDFRARCTDISFDSAPISMVLVSSGYSVDRPT